MNNSKAHPSLIALLLFPLVSTISPAKEPEPVGEEIFSESFEVNTSGMGSSSWFSFGGGTGFQGTYRVDESAGFNESQALVYQMRGSDSDGLSSYWYAGLGRLQMVAPQASSPDELVFKAWVKVPQEGTPKPVTIRFLQGTAEAPTWTSSQIVDVGIDGEFVELRLGDGEVTGEFTDSEPIHLHAILFGHGSFGFNRDIEFVIDEITIRFVPIQQ